MELITAENDKGRRLDRILRKALPDYPLALIHRLLRQGHVHVNGKSAKADDRVDSGTVIFIKEKFLTEASNQRFARTQRKNKKEEIRKKKEHPAAGKQEGCLQTENNAIPSYLSSFFPFHSSFILWQGYGLIAVNKPAGLEVHGSNSLDEMVRSYLADKITPSLSFKPGPLHRLDKPSSGIVVFSTDIDGARLFSSLLREHKVQKTYLALVEGNLKNEEIWENELIRDCKKRVTNVFKRGASPQDTSKTNATCNEVSRATCNEVSRATCNEVSRATCNEVSRATKTAITTVSPLKSNGDYSLICAQIITGRTHQIRAQAAAHGYPLAGDRKYNVGKNSARISNVQKNASIQGRGKGGFFLHAWKLEFLDVFIEAPLPQLFEKKLLELGLS